MENKRKDLISVIVPVYNSDLYLNRCINSIIKQTYTDLEIILIDDGSLDKSPQMCDEWVKKDKRICVIHKENGGAGSARNQGLKVATGEWIAFVDSDDWLELDAYMCMHRLAIEYNADMVIGQKRICRKENHALKVNRSTEVKIWDTNQSLDYFFRVNGEKGTHSVCNRMIKSSMIEGFSFLEGKMNEDILACFYFSVHAECTVCTDKTIYNYFVNHESVTRNKFTAKKLDLLTVWEIVYNNVKSKKPEYLYECEMNCKRAFFTLLAKMYIDGYDKKDEEMKKIKNELKTQVRHHYWSLIRWKMDMPRKILLTILCVIA